MRQARSFEQYWQLCTATASSARQWNYVHYKRVRKFSSTRTAPHNPASNGQAERKIQTFKNALNKMMNEKGAINEKSIEMLTDLLYDIKIAHQQNYYLVEGYKLTQASQPNKTKLSK